MADVDLILGNRGPFAPQSPTDLTLTLGVLPGGAPFAAAVAATVRFGGAVSVLQLELRAATVAATVRFSGALTAVYDAGLPAYTEIDTGASWQDAEQAGALAGAAWQSAPELGVQPRLPWRDASALRPETALPWHGADAVRPPATVLPWRDGAPVRPPATGLTWQAGGPVRPPPVALPWRDAAAVWASAVLPWRDGLALRLDERMPWRQGARSLLPRRLAWREGAASALAFRLPWWHGAFVETDGGSPWPDVVVPPPFVPPVDLRFCRPWVATSPWALDLLLGLDPCVGRPPAAVVVPVRKVYIVFNDTHLIKLDGMVELPTLVMQLTIDADSWTWGFSATVLADQLPLLAPSGDGTPVMLAAVINGETYYVLAERLQRDRSFGVAAVRITGRGKSALLDAPYAPTLSFGNAFDRTAVQLLDDALKRNGVSIGWAAETALTDWLVPAGVWSHVGSHMSALLSVASAAGAYVQPHPTDDVLRVLARFPAAPWDWAGLSPDIELPSSVTTQEGISWTERPRYNRVFVSGVGQGVLCQVTRDGTAGDLVAPMITDPLITEAAAGRQRGLSVLADTGRAAAVSLRLPVLEETGVIVPGQLVRYVDGATVRIGLVRSTVVESTEDVVVWQTIGVDTYE